MCTATRTSSYSPVGRVCFYVYLAQVCILCIHLCFFDLFVCPILFVSLGSCVISLTVLGVSVTNLNEPPRALAASTIAWVRS